MHFVYRKPIDLTKFEKSNLEIQFDCLYNLNNAYELCVIVKVESVSCLFVDQSVNSDYQMHPLLTPLPFCLVFVFLVNGLMKMSQ